MEAMKGFELVALPPLHIPSTSNNHPEIVDTLLLPGEVKLETDITVNITVQDSQGSGNAAGGQQATPFEQCLVTVPQSTDTSCKIEPKLEAQSVQSKHEPLISIPVPSNMQDQRDPLADCKPDPNVINNFEVEDVFYPLHTETDCKPDHNTLLCSADLQSPMETFTLQDFSTVTSEVGAEPIPEHSLSQVQCIKTESLQEPAAAAAAVKLEPGIDNVPFPPLQPNFPDNVFSSLTSMQLGNAPLNLPLIFANLRQVQLSTETKQAKGSILVKKTYNKESVQSYTKNKYNQHRVQGRAPYYRNKPKSNIKLRKAYSKTNEDFETVYFFNEDNVYSSCIVKTGDEKTFNNPASRKYPKLTVSLEKLETWYEGELNFPDSKQCCEMKPIRPPEFQQQLVSEQGTYNSKFEKTMSGYQEPEIQTVSKSSKCSVSAKKSFPVEKDSDSNISLHSNINDRTNDHPDNSKLNPSLAEFIVENNNNKSKEIKIKSEPATIDDDEETLIVKQLESNNLTNSDLEEDTAPHPAFYCKKCNKVCNSAQLLITHNHKFHLRSFVKFVLPETKIKKEIDRKSLYQAEEDNLDTKCNIMSESCHFCGFRAFTKCHLEFHMKQHLSGNQYDSGANFTEPSNSIPNKRPRFESLHQYKCGMCTKSFESKSRLTKHLQIAHNQIELPRLFNGVKQYNQQHHALKKVKRFVCTICSKMYRGKHSFNDHVIKNHLPLLGKEVPLKIIKVDPNKDNFDCLGRSYWGRPDVPKKYTCKVCNMKLNSKMDAHAHMIEAHCESDSD